MKKFPDIVYLTVDPNSDSDGGDVPLAWERLDSADTGKVAVYRREEVLDKREVTEVRRQNTKTWFKPNGGSK